MIKPHLLNPPAVQETPDRILGQKDPREKDGYPLQYSSASLVKNPPTMQETWVQSLDWEDPLEKETATHCSILAWRIPWTEEPDILQSMGSQRANMTEGLSFLHCRQILYG